VSRRRPDIEVSDHAVLRYLERVEGVDIEGLRCRIARTVAIAAEQPMATGVISNGFVYKLRGAVVTTVVPNNQLDYAEAQSHGRPRRRRR
jgi:hypothetical protein